MSSQLRVDNILPSTGTSLGIGTASGSITFNSNISGNTTFNDNVTVGGVLTYEDVTYVDSVGIVTARGGLNVGPLTGIAATISSTGDITSSGTLYIASQAQIGRLTKPDVGLIVNNDKDNSSNNATIIVKNFNASGRLWTGTSSANATTSEIYGNGNANFQGNVGVGTDNPSTGKLCVGNTGESSTVLAITASTSGTSLLSFNDTNSGQGGLRYAHSTDHMQFHTADSEQMRLDSSGRLLIGTTSLINSSTASNFQIANASGPRLCIARNDTSTAADNLIGALDFYGNDSDGTYELCGRILAEADADHTTDSKLTRLTFYTAGSDPDVAEERLRIDSSGKVGINQTSPVHQLDVSVSDNTTYTAGNLILNGVARLHNESTTTNSFASLVFRTASGDNALGFVYTGTTNQADFVICNDGGSNGVERLRIDSSGRLLVGATASGGSGATLQIASSDAHKVQFHRGVASSGGPNINISKSRNTAYGSNTIVQNGDALGVIRFLGDDGTNLDTSAARIICQVDGTPGENDMPGRLVFETTADGASSETERLRIDSRGSFLFSNGFMNETVNINSTARTGTQAVNLDDGMVHYFTSSSTGTWKPNFTMSAGNDINATIATGDTFSVTMIVNKQNTAHYADTIQVDGSDVTPEWLGGAPTEGGDNNTFDVYSYSIIKTGDDAFKCFASVSNYT